jgi:hypothetical protein
MAPITLGDKSFGTLKDAEAFLRNFIKAHMTEHGRQKIDTLVLEAWMTPMLKRHPRYSKKLVGWTGDVMVMPVYGQAAIHLVMEVGDPQAISTPKKSLKTSAGI